MKFLETKLRGCYIAEIKPHSDLRGWFARIYCENDFKKIGFRKKFVQINHSYNKLKGTLRGLHFQIEPHPETKLIRCIHGSVFDVAVDLRKDSSTYLQWISVELSAANGKMILIPDGFAHGFLTLEDDTELIYHHTESYHPESERGIRYDDKAIAIRWPIPVSTVSDRDKKHPFIEKLS